MKSVKWCLKVQIYRQGMRGGWGLDSMWVDNSTQAEQGCGGPRGT